MPQNKVLLIDANSIVHRAYHALPNLKTSKGAYTGAIYGFLNIFLKIVKDFAPTHVAADTANIHIMSSRMPRLVLRE